MPEPGAGTRKVFTAGTHRVRAPEETWDLVAPLLPTFGITRVSDITGLDILGVPVAMATRPLAKTLSVSQGKGLTYALARVSAVMESIELWHCEYAPPAVVRSGTPARNLDLRYAVADVATERGALVGPSTPLDWVGAVGLTSARPTVVPADTARLLHPGEERWQPPGLRRDSNGLASGNSRAEAAAHALYEIVERDALSRSSAAARVSMDPGTLPDEAGAELVDRIRRAGASLDVTWVDNRFGLPCFAARVWSPDFPVSCLGYGAHSSAEIAVSRAITEAAQSRLTAIAGSRDDLNPVHRRTADGPAAPPPRSAERHAWRAVERPPAPWFSEVTAELDWAAGLVRRVAGAEPLLVDLSTVPELAVVKVVVPGCMTDPDVVHPRSSVDAVNGLFAAAGG